MPKAAEDTRSSLRSRWDNFHFSGKVIICSVLFGFGLVLIGAILMSINTGDGENHNVESAADRITPPISYVGPVIMGLGGLTVIIGVIMCLVETKICRKRNADASPLIAESQLQSDIENGDSKTSTSTSIKTVEFQKVEKPSGQAKDKRRKIYSNKHKMRRKSPSPKSPPLSSNEIKTSSSGNFSATTEEFQTPPNTYETEKMQPNRGGAKRDSLTFMRSFNSSETSLGKSAEYLTPCASYRDSSLESSIESLGRSIIVDEHKKKTQEKIINKNKEFVSPLASLDDNPELLDSNTLTENSLVETIRNDSNLIPESSVNASTSTSEQQSGILAESDIPKKIMTDSPLLDIEDNLKNKEGVLTSTPQSRKEIKTEYCIKPSSEQDQSPPCETQDSSIEEHSIHKTNQDLNVGSTSVSSITPEQSQEQILDDKGNKSDLELLDTKEPQNLDIDMLNQVNECANLYPTQDSNLHKIPDADSQEKSQLSGKTSHIHPYPTSSSPETSASCDNNLTSPESEIKSTNEELSICSPSVQSEECVSASSPN